MAKFGKTRIPPYRKKASIPKPNNCLRYWDLADHISIDDAIALWCGVEPAELAIIQSILAGQQPKCMSLLCFQQHPLPTDRVAQRELVAGFDV